MYAIDFKVKGVGAFPIDMLRYARCIPGSTDAAISIADDPRRNPANISPDPREIELIRFHPTKYGCRDGISPGCWQSFGWIVTHVGYERKM